MTDILTAILIYLWKRNSESAACLIISLANFGMNNEHVHQMAEYLGELHKDNSRSFRVEKRT